MLIRSLAGNLVLLPFKKLVDFAWIISKMVFWDAFYVSISDLPTNGKVSNVDLFNSLEF